MNSKPREPTACRHCGTPFVPDQRESEFCCGGCRYVYGLIHHKGLDQFYDLKDKTLAPVGPDVFHQSDLEWLERDLARIAASGSAEMDLELQGISCVGCVWLIERLFREYPGGRRIEVLANRAMIRLAWDPGQFDVLKFVRELGSFGYRVGPVDGAAGPEGKRGAGLSPLLTRLGICAALALNAMLFSLPFYLGMERSDRLAPLLETVCFLLATGSLVIGGGYFFKRCLRALRLGELHIDLPISIGLAAAYAGSAAGWAAGHGDLLYFDFVSIFTALMLAGRYLQERAIEQNRRRLLSSSTWAQRWHRVREGKSQTCGVGDLAAGDQLRVRPGQVVPVPGRLLQSAAMIGLDWITGESRPFLAQPGAHIPAGAVNVSSSALVIEAESGWSDSPLRQLLEVSDWSGRASPALQHIIRWYLVTVLFLAAAGAVGWALTGQGWVLALQVAISVLVVSCPCAVGVALPMADELAVKAARGCGVFIREATLWHRLRSIRTVVFDKTGTITLETPALKNPGALGALTEEQRNLLLNMVVVSPHPISKALREDLQKFAPGFRPVPPPGIREIPGSGLEWEASSGDVWRVGRSAWTLRGPFPQAAADCVFSLNGVPLAQFNFIEEVRADAVAEVKALRARGFDVFILSGDRPDNVRRMAALLGLPVEHGLAARTPEQKAEWIREQPQGSCLMVGDGANDSLAFDAAAVRATPSVGRGVLEAKADFYFLGKNLNGIRRVLMIADLRRRAIKRILAFTISYNLVGVGVALAGCMNPLVAAVIMPISSVLSLVVCTAASPTAKSITRLT